MRGFESLSGKKLRPLWTHKAKGIIWRLVPTTLGKLIGEERDVEKKTLLFFCLNQSTGEEMWTLQFGSDWWVGVETVYREMMLLHRFSSPDLPLHRSILAVNILTGARVWESEDAEFLGVGNEVVLASVDTAEGRRICEMEYRTGAVVQCWDYKPHSVYNAEKYTRSMETGAQFPIPLPNLMEVSPELEMIIRPHCPTEAIPNTVECVESKPYVVLSYYEHAPGELPGTVNLNNVLRIVNTNDGTIVFDDPLNRNVRSAVPESFFIQDKIVYSVKGRSLLTAVKLLTDSVKNPMVPQ